MEEIGILQQPKRKNTVTLSVGARCSYWFDPKFDVCVEGVPPNANVVKSSVDSKLSFHSGNELITKKYILSH